MLHLLLCETSITEQAALKTKSFVSSLSSWSATPQFNHDAKGSLGGGIHSLKVKESIRNTYNETKNALQQQSAGTVGIHSVVLPVSVHPYSVKHFTSS